MTKVITRSIPDATVAPSRKERSTHVKSDAPKRHRGVATQLEMESKRALELDRFESFSKGKDVAIALLGDLESSRGRDVAFYRRHRDGRPQFRFWRPHLEKLVSDPALIEGFDAVLSAAFEDGSMVSADELEKVAAAEFEEGEVGADGTLPDDENDATWKADKASRFGYIISGIEVAAANATYVMGVSAREASSDAMWGVAKLAELAEKATEAAFELGDENVNISLMCDASDGYAQALVICGMVNSDVDSEMAHAGEMLMRVAKDRIDAFIELIQKGAQA